MRSNGVEPTIEIIDALAEWHALFLEECLISIFGRKDKGTGSLLNMTDGGENPPSSKGKPGYWRGKTVPKDIVEKRAERIKESWSNRPGVWAGKTMSDETKKKMSLSHVGRKKSEEHKKNMRKPKEQTTCPFCHLTGGLGAMKRWHFENCKEKHA